jgi:hypothetical protein
MRTFAFVLALSFASAEACDCKGSVTSVTSEVCTCKNTCRSVHKHKHVHHKNKASTTVVRSHTVVR